jgi:hypothetical protein
MTNPAFAHNFQMERWFARADGTLPWHASSTHARDNATGPMFTASVIPLDISLSIQALQAKLMLAIQLVDSLEPREIAYRRALHEAKTTYKNKTILYAKLGDIAAKTLPIIASTGSINHKVPPSG